jgi:hypothetical protein
MMIRKFQSIKYFIERCSLFVVSCSGWLMNVDEYYMTSVQYILDTVVEELLHNPDRKFMFVEQVR